MDPTLVDLFDANLVTEPVEFASLMQAGAFDYGPAPQCLSGGWGSGKTHVACLKALYLSTVYRRNRGAICRRVGKDLRETTMATFYKICPPDAYDASRGGRRSDMGGYTKLADSESEILWLHLDDPKTTSVIRGLEINWFLIDQAEEDPERMEELFDMLRARLGRWDKAIVPDWMIADFEQREGCAWPWRHPKSDLPVPPAYAMLCVNPEDELHWIYRRFHPDSPEHLEHYRKRGYKLFHMPSAENRFLSKTNLEFLLDHDEAFVRRNVEGEWGIKEGAIHLISPLSVIDGSFELLEHVQRTCLLYRSLDHGDTAATCCLWTGKDRDGNLWVFREYYQPNALVSTHRGNITALSEGERYEDNLADPSIFTKMPQKKGGRWSVADEYSDMLEQAKETAINWNPADNNEMGTRNRINEYLRVLADHMHPVTRERGAPRVFFLKKTPQYPQGCYHVLRQIRAQRRVKIGTELGRAIFSDERDPTVIDHAYDPFRYIVAARPALPRAVDTPPMGSFLAVRKQLRQWQRRTAQGH
jgi:hypothetical protein